MMRTISNTFLVLGAAALLPACATVQSANDQEAAELTAQANVPMPDQWPTIRQQVGPTAPPSRGCSQPSRMDRENTWKGCQPAKDCMPFE